MVQYPLSPTLSPFQGEREDRWEDATFAICLLEFANVTHWPKAIYLALRRGREDRWVDATFAICLLKSQT